MDGTSRGSEVGPATAGTPSPTPSHAAPGAGTRNPEASASAPRSPPGRGPESGTPAAGPHGENSTASSGDAAVEEAKRPRACEACRGLKVRCEMAEEGPCRRCKKAGRRCVVTVRSRGGERQKKTDTRVSELERKIDALAASLHARGGPEHAGPAGGVQGGSAQRGRGDAAAAPASPEASRAGNPMMKTLLSQWGISEGSASPGQQTAGQKRKLSETQDLRADEASRPPNQRGTSLGDEYVDAVDRGLLTPERADAFFAKYTGVMAPHFPGIIFPPDYTAARLRTEKPLLFLAIMAAASSEFAGVQKELVKELTGVFAEKIMWGGEKSLELVQALFISVAWYYPPENFEELKFYQLAHIGIVMAVDLGLGRAGARPFRPGMATLGNFGPMRYNKVDPESMEGRRTWVVGYLLATNLSVGLRRANFMQWSPFLSECLEVLETSADAAPSDRYLCLLVRANKLGDEVTTKFSLDSPTMNVNLAEMRTQLSLKSFEKRLEKLRRDAPRESQKGSLVLTWASVDVYMHEMALHSEDLDNVRNCVISARLDAGLADTTDLTPAHIDAIVACYSAATTIFDTFIAMDIESLRTLPTFMLVRVAYATVVAVKIYFAAAAPDSELADVLPKESVKVEHYLDSMLSKFMAAAAEEKCRPAAKFLIVLAMLRGWFNNKMGGDKGKKAPGSSGTSEPGRDNASGQINGLPTPSRANTAAASGRLTTAGQELPAPHGPAGPIPPGQMPHQQGIMGYPGTTTANTPLQLLSEVATGGDSNMGGRASHLGWQNRPASGPAPQQAFAFMPTTTAGMPPTDMTPGMVGLQWTEAATGMGYLLGDDVDWEGVALNFGAGMSAEHEYELMNMMAEINKPWVGVGMPGTMPTNQGVYYQQ